MISSVMEIYYPIERATQKASHHASMLVGVGEEARKSIKSISQRFIVAHTGYLFVDGRYIITDIKP